MTKLPPPLKKKLGFAQIVQIAVESPGEQLLQCSYATD